MGEINTWIAKDLAFEEDGLTGDLLDFDCLNTTDMGKMQVAEASNEELEEAGSDSKGGFKQDEEHGSEGA